MKQLFKSMMFVAAAATLFAGCSKVNDDDPIPAAPSMVWEGNDLEAVHEITDVMSIPIKIMIPGGLQNLKLEIDSPALTAEMLGSVGLAPKMDLANPDNAKMEENLKALGLPAGKSIQGVTQQLFDISTLVPMIKAIYQDNSDHKFKVTVIDAKNQTITKTLTFHLTGPSNIAYNEDADLWKNTASLTAKVRIDGEVKVEYRKKDAADWQQAVVTKTDDITYVAAIAPTWKAEGKHATGVDQFSLDNATGIFAGNTYEYRLTVAGKEVDKKEFKAADGQTIPFGDMNTWSKYIGYITDPNDPQMGIYGKVDYPNKSKDESFWSTGSNHFTQTLCTQAEENENKVALLQGMDFGVYAAGSLFSGIFDFSLASWSGAACFGENYKFTARPTALKLRIKATINNISMISEIKENELTEADIDPARIFVCLTNWTERHRVTSGMPVLDDPSLINAFDPLTAKQEPAEGNVIAYGSKTITKSVESWTELIIPIIYKDKEAKPADDKFSLVISCSSSAYGDYLCGNPDNKLYVDDFEWVY